MLKRLVLLVSVVSLAVASAAATAFRVELYQPTTVNGTTFKAGDLKIELKDDKVTLKQGKVSVEANVKVENATSKFLYTTVGYKDGASHEVRDITVAGTTTRIIFASAPNPPTGAQ